MKTSELSALLDQFKKDTIKKFKKGRREHGQKWDEIDYNAKIEGELMDLLVYHWLRKKYRPSMQEVGDRRIVNILNSAFRTHYIKPIKTIHKEKIPKAPKNWFPGTKYGGKIKITKV